MKLINCPMNGLRPEDEFIYGGLIQPMPEQDADDATWVDYLFMDDNVPATVWEWWFHAPSGFWFVAHRDTASDVWLETITVEQAKERLAM